ncbi:MAG: molybdopterin molybdenumtransferase MoeA [Hyphomicrobiales bacterium]|nr:MAG: molybdopterin molybdenumtransferase MoeA [Hyphomicrobiales bacterium]
MPRTKRLLDDCFLTDADRLTHHEAQALLRERIGPVVDIETIPLIEAAGRILAEDIVAPRDVPAADNSAVDGYAFAYADYVAGDGWFPISARIAAGHAADTPLATGTAARIFTGAVMPAGANTVAMQEDCTREERDGTEWVHIPPGLKDGANRRRAGEDIQAGAAILSPGVRLRPQEVGAIASTGKNDVTVYRRLKVALVSTGDEIIRPGNPLGPGQVYDTNHFLLTMLLQAAGAEPVDVGVLPDDADKIQATLADLAATYDAIVTSGGASLGEEDHLIDAIDALGHRHLWQIAIKPGRPMSFGQIGDCVVLGLPGNPVAAFNCFLSYVRPTLVAMSGGGFELPRAMMIPAAFEVPKRKLGRREFLRGILVTGDDGTLRVQKFARDGSGIITSLREADGLIEIDEDTPSIEEGAPVRVLLFTEFGLPPRSVSTSV